MKKKYEKIVLEIELVSVCNDVLLASGAEFTFTEDFIGGLE